MKRRCVCGGHSLASCCPGQRTQSFPALGIYGTLLFFLLNLHRERGSCSWTALTSTLCMAEGACGKKLPCHEPRPFLHSPPYPRSVCAYCRPCSSHLLGALSYFYLPFSPELCSRQPCLMRLSSTDVIQLQKPALRCYARCCLPNILRV